MHSEEQPEQFFQSSHKHFKNPSLGAKLSNLFHLSAANIGFIATSREEIRGVTAPRDEIRASWQSLGLKVLFSGTDTALSTQMPSAVE